MGVVYFFAGWAKTLPHTQHCNLSGNATLMLPVISLGYKYNIPGLLYQLRLDVP